MTNFSQFKTTLRSTADNLRAHSKSGFRDRRQQSLFIDPSKLGALIDRVHRDELTDAELHAQFDESAKLEQAIQANLRGLNLKPLI